jgi:endonuclease/exonuclease/phosphatase family metal-dependent hydrolase
VSSSTSSGCWAQQPGILRASDHGQQRPVVVAGDLNDEAQAATTQILLGPPGSEIGTAGYDQPDAGDGARLWNLAALIPEAER